MFRAVYHCACTSGPCAKRPAMPIFLGDPLPGGEWSLCPHGEMRHPMLSAAIEIDNHAQISGLAGWPDTYSAGVVSCIVALRLERAEHHAEQLRQARGD